MENPGRHPRKKRVKKENFLKFPFIKTGCPRGFISKTGQRKRKGNHFYLPQNLFTFILYLNHNDHD